jgi:hypothetical protein
VNVEELLRRELRTDADTVAPIDDLLDRATRRGRRKLLARRAGIVVVGVAMAGVVASGSLLIANRIGAGGQQVVRPAAGGGTTASGQPWWQTWTTGRHDGPLDRTFLTNARPTYDGTQGPEPIKVWATGTEPDGTDWVMFTDPHDGHRIQWLQGWNGQPDYGEGMPDAKPGMTWTSFSSPTLAAHDSDAVTDQWLIVVGKPGTTSIEYAADGVDYTPLTVHDGIAVLRTTGFAPATAKVRLSDSTGVYATGTPYDAGASDPSTSPSPDGSPGTATPTPTPGDGVSTAPSSSPSTSSQ